MKLKWWEVMGFIFLIVFVMVVYTLYFEPSPDPEADTVNFDVNLDAGVQASSQLCADLCYQYLNVSKAEGVSCIVTDLNQTFMWSDFYNHSVGLRKDSRHVNCQCLIQDVVRNQKECARLCQDQLGFYKDADNNTHVRLTKNYTKCMDFCLGRDTGGVLV